jgi:hypothetical protein
VSIVELIFFPAEIENLILSWLIPHRMCTTKSVPTLPDGVTLRDDAMAKTNAFLVALPKLT